MEVVARRKGIRLDRDRFDYELDRRGLTARRLAELAGIQEETLSRARHGATLREATLRRITEALLAQPLVAGFDLLIARPDRGEPA
jgi:transcriptional regulator with XRE-family HTH domain